VPLEEEATWREETREAVSIWSSWSTSRPSSRSTQLEERPQPKKDQAKAPVVDKSSEKKEKRRTCYICREKGHISSFCTSGNSSNPILIHGAYSLHKDKVGDVFAKYVGTQSGFIKRTIWVAKPIVTKFLGHNLVGDQQVKI
jgi:hypothetical protein